MDKDSPSLPPGALRTSARLRSVASNIERDGSPTPTPSTSRPPRCKICRNPKKGHPRSGCPYASESPSVQAIYIKQSTPINGTPFTSFIPESRSRLGTPVSMVQPALTVTNHNSVSANPVTFIPTNQLTGPYSLPGDLRVLLGVKSLTLENFRVIGNNEWAFNISGSRECIERWIKEVKDNAGQAQLVHSSDDYNFRFIIGIILGIVSTFLFLAFMEF
ncbi:hypothetical protein DFP72DRAFT_1132807 [Ephemerocybe angulata]|uniref:Uncharacterized protein n=1 Tax=Ephemerocybe angulata TaxID=980116 RepID=A0A8H6LRB3_9AGAR|nr:hypothetical protein DFP72DRAFT_1087066 [Tulosesus angulatus]KAF6752558.1 hypothetical protein DFP72DRAFT_1132807 [Tulosesus angulatus]